MSAGLEQLQKSLDQIMEEQAERLAKIGQLETECEKVAEQILFRQLDKNKCFDEENEDGYIEASKKEKDLQASLVFKKKQIEKVKADIPADQIQEAADRFEAVQKDMISKSWDKYRKAREKAAAAFLEAMDVYRDTIKANKALAELCNKVAPGEFISIPLEAEEPNSIDFLLFGEYASPDQIMVMHKVFTGEACERLQAPASEAVYQQLSNNYIESRIKVCATHRAANVVKNQCILAQVFI